MTVVMAPLTWNANRETTVSGGRPTHRTAFHAKWANYLRADGVWSGIDLTPRQVGGEWVFDRGPYALTLPSAADGWTTFEATNRFDIHTRTVKGDAKVGIQKRYLAAPVPGVVTPEGLSFTGAFPAIGASRLIRPHEQKVSDLIVISSAPPGSRDAEVGIEIDFGNLPAVESTGRGKPPKDSDLRKQIDIKHGLTFSDGGSFRGVQIKAPRAWDSAGRSVEIVLRGKVQGSRFVGVKVIPRDFLDRATYPVYADTTSTFYPDPHTETTSFDGQVTRSVASESWLSLRTGAGNGGSDNQSQLLIVAITDGASGLAWQALYRCPFLFDTSAIPDADVVSTVVKSLYSYQKDDNGSQSITITPGTTTSNTGFNTSDFEANTSATTYATVDVTDVTTGQYTDFTLDAAGIASINKSGVTKFCAKISGDTDNLAPSVVPTLNLVCGMRVYSADRSGTSEDPKLVVTHAAAGRLFRPGTLSGVGSGGMFFHNPLGA